MAEAMQVGRTTNLLEGIGHFWHSPSGVLRFADETPVATGNAQRTDVDGSWSPAQVSIHDSANALVDALFDLRIDSLAGEPQLTNIALHRLLAAKPQRAEVRLRPGKSSTTGTLVFGAGKAGRYLDYFERFGTHFVSQFESGEVLHQVVTFSPAKFEMLAAHIGPDGRASGQAGFACVPLLQPEVSCQLGHVWAQSGDAALTDMVERGLFDDAHGRPSLLAALAEDERRNTSRLVSLQGEGCVSIRLTQLSRLMEFYRAVSFERVFKGCLIQQHGRSVQVPVHVPATNDAPNSDVPSGVGSSSTVVGAGSVFGQCITERDMNALPEEAQACTVVGARIDLAEGSRVELLAGVPAVVASQMRSTCMSSATAPVMVVRDDDLGRFVLRASSMMGLLLITNETGDDRVAVFQGLRFASQNGRIVVEDVERPLSAATAARAMLPIGYWCLSIAMLLASPNTRSHGLAQARGLVDLSDGDAPATRCTSVSRWLATVIDEDAVSEFSSRALSREQLARLVQLAAEIDALRPAGRPDSGDEPDAHALWEEIRDLLISPQAPFALGTSAGNLMLDELVGGGCDLLSRLNGAAQIVNDYAIRALLAPDINQRIQT